MQLLLGATDSEGCLVRRSHHRPHRHAPYPLEGGELTLA